VYIYYYNKTLRVFRLFVRPLLSDFLTSVYEYKLYFSEIKSQIKGAKHLYVLYNNIIISVFLNPSHISHRRVTLLTAQVFALFSGLRKFLVYGAIDRAIFREHRSARFVNPVVEPCGHFRVLRGKRISVAHVSHK